MKGQYERALETFNSEVTVTLEEGIIHFQRGENKYSLCVKRVRQQSNNFVQGIEFVIAHCLDLPYDTEMYQVIQEKLKSQQLQTE